MQSVRPPLPELQNSRKYRVAAPPLRSGYIVRTPVSRLKVGQDLFEGRSRRKRRALVRRKGAQPAPLRTAPKVRLRFLPGYAPDPAFHPYLPLQFRPVECERYKRIDIHLPAFSTGVVRVKNELFRRQFFEEHNAS